jgi:8-amino-3,8-dideoxy-alpha-D-manno-octulosonate transaminase
MSEENKQAVMHYANKDFSASDKIMSCCISTSISLLWSEEDIEKKAKRMVEVIKKVL